MSEWPANDDAHCPCSWGDRELGRNRPVHFHRDAQDPGCDGWKRLLELVERAANEHWVEFAPFTSARLHWLPYEITRCSRLAQSTISTRRLYGNLKHRAPFPQLEDGRPETAAPGAATACSICSRVTDAVAMKYLWTSQPVGTDVVPLLVNACSEECIGRIPPSPEGYNRQPHHGGCTAMP